MRFQIRLTVSRSMLTVLTRHPKLYRRPRYCLGAPLSVRGQCCAPGPPPHRGVSVHGAPSLIWRAGSCFVRFCPGRQQLSGVPRCWMAGFRLVRVCRWKFATLVAHWCAPVMAGGARMFVIIGVSTS
jgi:hypothetical protein